MFQDPFVFSFCLDLIKMMFSLTLCIVIIEVGFPHTEIVYMSHLSELVINSVCVCLNLDLFLASVTCVSSIQDLVSAD